MTQAEVGLARDLRLFDLTMIGVGAMIGAGVFVLTGIGAGVAGPALILAFALNGAVTLLTAMVYAELGSAIPEAGGGYLWVQEALGPLQSFTAGWMSWFAHAVAGSLYALGFGAFAWELLHVWLGDLPGFAELGAKSIGVLIVLIFLAINYRGASETGKAGNVVTLVKIAIIGLFIASGVFTLWQHPERVGSFDPFFAQGIPAIVTAMGLTFIAFEGYEIIAQAGEEVVNPKENVPKAVFWSLLIVVPIYVLVAITAIGAITPLDGMATWEFLGEAGELGLLRAAEDFMPAGFVLLLVGGLVSTMSALNATTFSSTRVAFAMARDRVLPAPVSQVHPRTRVPVVALMLSGLIMIVMVLFVPIEGVAAAADIMFLLLFLQVNVTVIKIRRRLGEELDYGYKMPFFPVVPIVAIVLMAGLAAFLFFYEPGAWGIAIAWIVAGLLVFYVYSKEYQTRAKSESELVFEQRPPQPPGYSVLVPLANPRTLAHLVETATAIAQDRGGSVQYLSLVQVPHQLPLRDGHRYVDERRAILEEAEARSGEDVDVHTAVRIGHDVTKDIVFSAREFRSDLVLMGWRALEHDASAPERLVRALREDTMRHVVAHARCDVVVAKQGIDHAARRVVVPVRGNRHATLALQVARAVARARGLPVKLVHYLAPNATNEEHEAAQDLLAAIAEGAGVAQADVELAVERVDNVHDRLVQEGGPPSILVLGASERRWYRQHLFGETPEVVAARAQGTVFLVRKYEGFTKSKLREFVTDLLDMGRSTPGEADAPRDAV